MRRTLITRCAGLVVCLTLFATSIGLAASDTYPSKPIRFVVPFTAGSATDTLARIIGQNVSQTLGQPVIVENVPGANGQIGASMVARAAPDGYTILIGTNSTHAFNQALYKKLTYDHVKDFEPISKLGSIALALVINPQVPAKTTQELIAYAKANPGKLSYGSGAASARLAMEMFKLSADVDILYVPYKSNPQAVADLLGDQVQVMLADMSTTLPSARAGKLRALGVSSAGRSRLAPDLPTMQEAGLKGYDLYAWFGAFAPAKTPEAIVDALDRAFIKAMNDKAVQEALLGAGIEPSSSTPEELAAFVASETKKLAESTKAAGIEPE
ncbi:tripartite tricarboxylate transporter substrate binding protein [Aquabacter sp. CN5-332]|uniref:Bug family tripartite tricarboxylate transporter substrate binding protein n=1 Tax=Aquabacter sp. CN5-332 TaxID=3156608 RepID=UPI0032B61932